MLFASLFSVNPAEHMHYVGSLGFIVAFKGQRVQTSVSCFPVWEEFELQIQISFSLIVEFSGHNWHFMLDPLFNVMNPSLQEHWFGLIESYIELAGHNSQIIPESDNV